LKVERIVITGGPGTGKSSIINELERRNHLCYQEVSREVTLEARKNGVDQLFLTNPLRFSELLLKARTNQFESAVEETQSPLFYDRGLPDVLAYMDFVSNEYPEYFNQTCRKNLYDQIYILPPWKDIYVSDSERYESFEQAVKIHHQLVKTYRKFGYQLIEVPHGSIKERTDFILNGL